MAIHTYAIGNVVQVITVFFIFIGMILIGVAAPALNYPAYEQKINKIINDPTLITNCQAEAALGDNSCVNKLINTHAWSTWEWFVFYFTLPLLLTALFFTVIYLMYQKYGFTWFIMVFWMVVVGVWLVIIIIQLVVWWMDCKSFEPCSTAKYDFDFTGTVKHATSPYWIVFNVGVYVVTLGGIVLLFASIGTQACLSRAVTGRDDALDPLFTEEDKRAIASANRPISGSIGGGLPSHVMDGIKQFKSS